MRASSEGFSRPPATLVRDIMTSDVVTVSPDLPLTDLVELFIGRHISGAPVISGRRVVGVVSATDLLTFAASAAGRPRPVEQEETDEADNDGADLGVLDEPGLTDGAGQGWDAFPELDGGDLTSDGRAVLAEYTVADVMSTDVQSLPPDTDLARAAATMKNFGVHRLLIMRDGELQGIVSSMDVVAAVARGQSRVGETLLAHEADFDSGWTHEPVVPEAD